MSRRRFQRAIRTLRRELPCAFPVRVRTVQRVERHDPWGDCERRDGDFAHFVIRIAAANEEMMIATLIHEWAHARCWNHLHDTLDIDATDAEWHGEEWGIEFSRCYRAVISQGQT